MTIFFPTGWIWERCWDEVWRLAVTFVCIPKLNWDGSRWIGYMDI